MKRVFHPSSGAINTALFAFLGSFALLIGLIAVLMATRDKKNDAISSKSPLIVFCAASLKLPVEAIARDYEKHYGIRVQLQFGASQTLLANLEVAKTGDIYIPADDSYTEMARSKKLVNETIPLARQQARIAVKKGNPEQIKSVADLMTGEVKIAQANPDAAAIGKLVRTELQKQNLWDGVLRQTAVMKGTVTDAATDVKLGAVDASFGWDSMAKQFADLDFIAAPELETVIAQMSVCILASAPRPAAALHFARYLSAHDRGLLHFKEAGFAPVEGDVWSESPEVRLLSGAMLRPAIEQTITDFEKREGVRVTRVYNGCGILVAQMKAGDRPDSYFACDASFMKEVNDLFLDATTISQNQLVILVKKGNPFGVKSLKDLGKPGLKLGVGHEQQCALGALTKTTFLESGVFAEVEKNIAVRSPTGDLLVNQLRTGSLDAVVAYISNATNSGDLLEPIAIDIPCAIAVQPIAVAKGSSQKNLTTRLLSAIQSAHSRELFESTGFKWLNDVKKPVAATQGARP